MKLDLKKYELDAMELEVLASFFVQKYLEENGVILSDAKFAETQKDLASILDDSVKTTKYFCAKSREHLDRGGKWQNSVRF